MKRIFRARIAANLILCVAAMPICMFFAVCTRGKADTACGALEGQESVFVVAARRFYDCSGRRRIEARAIYGQIAGRTDFCDYHARSFGQLGGSRLHSGRLRRGARQIRARDSVPYNLRNPNSIAFHQDAQGQDWFYVALTDRLVRYKFTRGEERPTSQPEVLATYPAYGLSYKYGGWHLTRTITFGQGDSNLLYVTVGSSCNACDEKEEIRATLSVMDADGKNQRIIARGLRNAVGMRFVGGALFLTNMGADHLGDDEPDDPMFSVSPSALQEGRLDYGWPHCYYSGGKAKADPRFPLGPSRTDCRRCARCVCIFRGA